MSDIKNSGREVVFVTSGAQGVGAAQAGLPCKPTDMPGKQAVAAIGQSELMTFYSETFGKFNHTVAQILLTLDVKQLVSAWNPASSGRHRKVRQRR